MLLFPVALDPLASIVVEVPAIRDMLLVKPSVWGIALVSHYWHHAARRPTPVRPVNRSAKAGIIAVCALALAGCASGDIEADAIELPPTQGVFDYQLGGASDDAAGERIDVVVRDAAAEPLEGAYSVCYVNGFQTQPGDDAWDGRDDLLLLEGGEPVVDPDWPDERILDPSTLEQREGILEIVGPVIEGCARAGFDAVEFDNLDTWTRFDAIDPEGAQALAQEYAVRAHEVGLAAAQKNAAEVAATARAELGFDFAVVEECAAWAECAAYAEAYGDSVLQIEYPDALAEAGLTFADVCAAEDRAPLTILRDRALAPHDEPGALYRRC